MGDIIQFPGSAAPKPDTPAAPAQPPKPQGKKSGKGKKKKIPNAAYVLAVILMATTFMNFYSQKESGSRTLSSSGGRAIASIGSFSQERGLSGIDESRLVKSLQDSGRRSIASLGSEPSPEDKLRFETLDSRYRLSFENGVVTGIAFTPDWESGGTPKYVTNREAFLKSYRRLLPPFEQIEQTSRNVEKDTVTETYKLKAGSGDSRLVAFELDLFGRLLSMKVQDIK